MRKFILATLVVLVVIGLSSCASGTVQPEVATTQPEVATTQPEVTTAEPEVATEQPKELDEVTLRILLPGDRPTQMDEVIAEAERRMAEEGLNIRLDVVFVPWSDLGNIAVQLAAGEEIDLAFDAPWLAVNQNVAQGFYLELSDLLKEYGPNVLASRPDVVWEANRVGDGVYVIPLVGVTGGGKQYIVRKDIREALAFEPISSMEELEQFLYAVKENYPDMIPLAPGPDGAVNHFLRHDFDTSVRGATTGGDIRVLYFRGNDGIVRNLFDERDPLLWSYVQLVGQWREDGLIPSDMAPGGTYDIINGNVAVMPTNDYGYTLDQLQAVKDLGGDLEWFTLYDQSKKQVNSFAVWNMIAIPYTSKHPERAMMFLNWANQQATYDLLAYGIEGETYTPVGEEAYEPNPDNLYRWYPYAWIWNPEHDRQNAASAPGVIDWNLWAANPDSWEPDILLGFKFNDEPVLNEVAQLSALHDQYLKPLLFGVVTDIDAWWAEYESQAAPLARTVQAEYQKQIDAFSR
jgi:putative aldouronate transport system substrate-binding protein